MALASPINATASLKRCPFSATGTPSSKRTLTFSGWLETGGTNEAVELYTLPSGWGPELLAPFTPPLYPWLHLLPDGRVFESGPQIDSHVFNPATQTWATDVAETLYPTERTYGS